MGSIVTAAQAIAEQLADLGIPATIDPAKAATTARGVVYVEPPSLTYTGRGGNRWRLVALSGQSAGTLAAINDLDALVQAVTAALPIETATYATYQLVASRAGFPAYLMTLTT